MSESTNPRAPTVPQDGDVVVARESKSATRYTVRQVPGVVQFAESTRDEALRLARSFAKRHAVDLWYSDEGTYRLLEAYRPRNTTTTSGHRVDVV